MHWTWWTSDMVSRLPDLSAIFSCGVIRRRQAITIPIENTHELRRTITVACERMLQNTEMKFLKRVERCISNGGGHEGHDSCLYFIS